MNLEQTEHIFPGGGGGGAEGEGNTKACLMSNCFECKTAWGGGGGVKEFDHIYISVYTVIALDIFQTSLTSIRW